MPVSLSGEIRRKIEEEILEHGFDEIDAVPHESRTGGEDGRLKKVNKDPWFNLRDPVIREAFNDLAGGTISDNVINYLLGPVQFWFVAKSLGSTWTDEMLAWLMDPLPQDHPWIRLLSDDQKKFMKSGWSVNERYLYGYPITRLEYWTTAFVDSSEGSQVQLQVGPWTLAESNVKVAWNKAYVASDFSIGKIGEEWVTKNSTPVKWGQKMFDLNREWWEASWNIVMNIWGKCYESGKETTGGRVDAISMDLKERKVGWKDQHVQFVNMLCTNQNKGNLSVTTETAAWGLMWSTVGGQFEKNPWVTDGSINRAKWQWIYSGSEAATKSANDGDPVNVSIIQKLLYTDQGYNQPFKFESMGWREIKAFMTPTSYTEDGGIETISMASQAAYLNTLTADSFLEQVLVYLKAEGDIQVWDGVLKESAGKLTKISTTLRDGDPFRDKKETAEMHPGPSKAPTWKSRDDKKDGEDWDTGLFYWEDDFDAQIASIDKTEKDEDRSINSMGLSRLHYWLLPKANRENHWLKVGGKDPHSTIWKDHSDAIRCLAAGDIKAYPGDLWKQSWTGVLGRVAQQGTLLTALDLALDDDDEDSAVVTGGDSDPKMPTKKPYVKASAFTDWEGLLKRKPNENTKLSTTASESVQAVNRLLGEAAIFTPDEVDFGNSDVEVTRDFTFDLAADVNGLSPNKLKGTGFDAEAASEDAKEAVDAIKDAFIEFAGSKEKGRGPKVPQATAQWFRDNFKTNQVVPRADDTNGPNPTSFSFSSMDEEGAKALKKVLTEGDGGYAGGDTIRMAKAEYPWDTILYPDSQGVAVPFAELLRMYQGAAYMTALHYRMARQNHDDVKVLLTEIWDHFAFKCAYHFYRIWERQLHDHQVGNLYALMVIILARLDDTSDEAKEALEALAAALRGADDDSMRGQTEAPPPEPEEDSQTDKDQRERFYKQCALMLNMHNLVSRYDMSGVMHEKSKDEGYSSYNGRIHLVSNQAAASGQNNTILNKLITPTPDSMKPFTEIAPDKASELLPYIRFFRVWNDPDGNLLEIEFDFPQYGTREMNETFDRGDGVGMQEFTWECDGETPATASKYINATLTLTFQSFDDFTRERMNKANLPFRWVDMFVSPTSVVAKGDPNTDTPHHLRYDSEYYRIRVDLGYHPSIGGDLGRALNTQNRSFFLVLKDNEITINKDMSVTIQANYGAYIEEAMDSNKFNALSTPDIKKKEREYKQKWAAATKSFKEGGCDDKQLRQIRATINAQLEDLMKKQHKSVMTNLLNLERIFHVDMESKDIDNYRQGGAFTSIPRPTDGDKVKPGSDAANKLRQKMMAMDNPDRKSWAEANEPHKDYRIYYFYLGDLIYLLNSAMYEGESPWVSQGIYKDAPVSGAENTKLLLMDFDYHNPLAEGDTSRKTINIAHIPVSVDYFFQWYVNNIIKNEVYHMGVGNFIKRVLDNLITEAFAEVCLSSEEGQYVTFQHGSISAAGNSVDIPGATDPMFTDPITSMMLLIKDSANNPFVFDVHEHYNVAGRPDGTGLPLRFIPDNTVLQQHNRNGVQGQFQYIYIYGDSKDPFHIGRGIRDEDNIRGCYHLDLARNNGLVKNISFSKNNIPYLRESRMFNQGQAGLLQLSAVYDCEIEMIGNTLFLPGQEVWVNPYGFGGESFGKPQDPPLEWSPKHSEINAFNDIVDRIQADGNVTPEEIEEAADYLDNLESAVATRQSSTNLVVGSYANVMGIGGYQLIIRTKCTIKPGEFSTTISAKHTFSGYPMLKQSLDLIEYRQGRPSSIAAADEATSENACSAILGAWEDAPIRE